MYGVRIQTITFVQEGQSLMVAVRSDRYSITLTPALSYLKPHLQLWQGQDPQDGTGQEKQCPRPFWRLSELVGWTRLEPKYLEKASRDWVCVLELDSTSASLRWDQGSAAEDEGGTVHLGQPLDQFPDSVTMMYLSFCLLIYMEVDSHCLIQGWLALTTQSRLALNFWFSCRSLSAVGL